MLFMIISLEGDLLETVSVGPPGEDVAIAPAFKQMGSHIGDPF